MSEETKPATTVEEALALGKEPMSPATKWNTYRMWYRVAHHLANGGSSAEWLGDWKPTEITFRARTQPEAQKKADRFWRDAQLGFGSMVCLLLNDNPQPTDG